MRAGAQIEDENLHPPVWHVSPLVPIVHAEHRQVDDRLSALMRVDLASVDFSIEVRCRRPPSSTMLGRIGRYAQSHVLGEAALEELGERLPVRTSCTASG